MKNVYGFLWTSALCSFLLTLALLTASACSPSTKTSEHSIQQQQPATELTLLTYNIKHGLGNDGVVALERSAQVINGLEPDLVALQEIDNGCERTEAVDQATKLGELTGMYSAFGKFMDYQGGEYGMALLSKFPFVEVKNHRLPTPGESPGSAEFNGVEPRTALACTIRVGPQQEEVVFVSIHLYQTAEQRLAQAQELLAIYTDEKRPVILAGDFNSTPDSPVMNLIRTQWYIPDKGEDNLTIRSDNPRREIDFIIYKPEDHFSVVESRVIDERIVSDHRPVLLKVKF